MFQRPYRHSISYARSFFMTGQIIFLQEPRNVTVTEGVDAFFPCTYYGTNRSPHWKINSSIYSISDLPPRHLYNGSGLVISNVDLSLNMTSYSCFIEVIARGEFIDIESNIGFLLIPGLQMPYHCVFPELLISISLLEYYTTPFSKCLCPQLTKYYTLHLVCICTTFYVCNTVG